LLLKELLDKAFPFLLGFQLVKSCFVSIADDEPFFLWSAFHRRRRCHGLWRGDCHGLFRLLCPQLHGGQWNQQANDGHYGDGENDAIG